MCSPMFASLTLAWATVLAVMCAACAMLLGLFYAATFRARAVIVRRVVQDVSRLIWFIWSLCIHAPRALGLIDREQEQDWYGKARTLLRMVPSSYRAPPSSLFRPRHFVERLVVGEPVRWRDGSDTWFAGTVREIEKRGDGGRETVVKLHFEGEQKTVHVKCVYDGVAPETIVEGPSVSGAATLDTQGKEEEEDEDEDEDEWAQLKAMATQRERQEWLEPRPFDTKTFRHEMDFENSEWVKLYRTHGR